MHFRQRIRFTDGTFTFGYRDIPRDRLSYIDNWAITDSSGNRYQLATGGTEPYTFAVTDSGYRLTHDIERLRGEQEAN